MYTCTFFSIEELVPQDIYKQAKKKGLVDKLWLAFDARLLRAIDALRKHFGPITINTWVFGGGYTESGLRSFGTTTGAYLSQHKFGRAFDFRSKQHSPKEIYEDMLACGGTKSGFVSADTPWKGITRLEYYPGITWTHIDVSDAGNADGSIRVFRG